MSAPAPGLAAVVAAALDELAEAVREVFPTSAGGPRVYVDPTSSSRVNPPALLFGPPTFTWETPSAEPDEMTVTAALVVAASDTASARLLALLPQVVEAIETAPDAVVRRAAPGSFDTEAGELPAYLLEIEAAL